MGGAIGGLPCGATGALHRGASKRGGARTATPHASWVAWATENFGSTAGLSDASHWQPSPQLRSMVPATPAARSSPASSVAPESPP